MRVLVSSGWLGGAGGAERATYSVLRALDGHAIDLVVRRRLDGPLAEVHAGVTVSTIRSPRWVGAARRSGWSGLAARAVVNPVRRALTGKYDVYLQFLSGMNVSDAVRSGLRLVVPSGEVVDPRRCFGIEHVAMQAPDNVRFVPAGMTPLLLVPPVYPLSDTSDQPTQQLPRSYYLTVFNPWDPVKGADDLMSVLDQLPAPLVWCHSSRTAKWPIPSELATHSKIIHVEDARPSRLRHLYEHCRAYISFSKSEGFGWAIADALRYAPSVVSRRIGVLTHDGATGLEGVTIASDMTQVDWRNVSAGTPTLRDLEWFSPERFRRTLGGLAVDGTSIG